MHILRVPIPVGREPPVPQDDGVCPISLHRLASRRRLADDLELEAWVELHGQAVWRIYIYIYSGSIGERRCLAVFVEFTLRTPEHQ